MMSVIGDDPHQPLVVHDGDAVLAGPVQHALDLTRRHGRVDATPTGAEATSPARTVSSTSTSLRRVSVMPWRASDWTYTLLGWTGIAQEGGQRGGQHQRQHQAVVAGDLEHDQDRRQRCPGDGGEGGRHADDGERTRLQCREAPHRREQSGVRRRPSAAPMNRLGMNTPPNPPTPRVSGGGHDLVPDQGQHRPPDDAVGRAQREETGHDAPGRFRACPARARRCRRRPSRAASAAASAGPQVRARSLRRERRQEDVTRRPRPAGRGRRRGSVRGDRRSRCGNDRRICSSPDDRPGGDGGRHRGDHHRVEVAHGETRRG